ncbi:MAG: DUF1684 domain-containing protein [Bacteroidales bacterium]|nr:DUF1684 domain-containing protein [Bacteroidales bacterium]MBN2761968.1 DUF1684 domain-containing protein [Bacteroidales bacterium]
MDVNIWKNTIIEERNQKDLFFKNHSDSPIPFFYRQQFSGLNYYPPDPDVQFELKLHEHNEKKILKINDTKGNVRKFFRWGEFLFRIKGEECVLQAYKSHSGEEGLFVPFRDKTSGKETYGAGRYIDLDVGEHYTTDGKWILDFNKAYNPWCAYSEYYACPYVEPENWLKVTVYAGEKKYLTMD